MNTTTTLFRKLEAKEQSLVEGADVAAYSNPKRTTKVRCCAETENGSQSVHALQEVLVVQSCVCASTVATLFVHMLTQLHQSH